MDSVIGDVLQAALIFIVALLYSSVGHGGASGYLAVLSFFDVSQQVMSATALALNVMVAGVAFGSYARAGRFNFRLTLPFAVASIPAAYIGGVIDVPDDSYKIVLGVVLAYAAVRIAIPKVETRIEKNYKPRLLLALVCGFGIGLLSGAIGIGGGIFLSPLLLLMRWADAKTAAASSAFFIVVNSVSGLVARIVKSGAESDLLSQIHILGPYTWLIAAALLGGIIGSHVGSSMVGVIQLKRLLALVMLIAAAKLVITAVGAGL